jgi:hypothetical protein
MENPLTASIPNIVALFPDQNDSLAPRYEVDWVFMEQKIKEFVFRYNYTLNPLGVYEAIKFMYTYWPDPNNKTHIRDQYVHVSWMNSMASQLLLICGFLL